MVKIGIVGCAGRMGRMLIQEVLAAEGCVLAGGTEREGGDAVGRDLGDLVGAGPLGVLVGSDPKTLFEHADAVIDFTSPAATVEHAALAAETRKIHVIGTTGLDAGQQALIGQKAGRAAIVQAPNFSAGVTMMLALVEQAARALDDSFDIEIIEMHHRHKVDAPSGTALGLGKAAAGGRGVTLEDVWRKSRDGHTGARPKGEIGFATLRGGDVVGDHTVVYAADGERIEITHKAASRAIFAKGAVRAAIWAAGKPPGLYSMKDVLGLS